MKYSLAMLICMIIGNGYAQGPLIDHFTFKQGNKTINFQERMREQGVTAVSAIVIQDDFEELITEGYLEKNSDQSITPETLFPVGALSIYPAVIELHRLVALGEMSLQDPVRKYVPEVKDGRWWKQSELTLEDLLLFRKKMNGPYKPTGYANGERLILPEDLLRQGNKDFPGGVKIKANKNKSADSNCTTALLLQIILERHHQKPLAEIIEQQIFRPLGMKHSFYASELNQQQESLLPIGHIKGQAIPNGYRRYALQAAMCLWTTPRDYAILIQHVFAAAKGEDNRLLPQSIAKKGITAQYAYHSLIFHSKDGRIYGGGNAKGFYTCIDADPATGMIQVMFANGDVVWPLVNFALNQTPGWLAIKNSKEKVSLVVQPGDEYLRETTEAFLRDYCSREKINFEIISANTAPLAITATPAVLFTSPKGWSLYGGPLDAPKALENYLRNTRGRPVMPQAYSPGELIFKKRQQQSVGIPLKWTDWKGDQPKREWKKLLINSLCEKWGAQYEAGAEFLPNDRRYYLDVHPFAKKDSVFLSIAIFSQYNCIQPIFENFNNPISGISSEPAKLLDQLSSQALAVINQYIDNATYGEALMPLNKKINKTSFDPAAFVTIARADDQVVHDPSLNGIWKNPSAARRGRPILQFNFPSPLDRYAGEVKTLNGNLEIADGNLRGIFTANLSSLTLGNKDFDAKVLKDYLRVKKFPAAQFSFADFPANLNWDKSNTFNIPGLMTLMEKEVPLIIEATFSPQSQSQVLMVQVSFSLNIADPFGLPGPDGPESAKKMLDFYLQFQLNS